MTLAAGSKLGPYEILAPIGKGGMGEVWKARDTRLKRDVALKVLPDALARDPERMSRFQREAEVLASLNHPNIAAIYGVEDSALVMELVEGESPKGPMPFDEAWKIGSQIATALEYAHDKGVIHRDLKPANIKITPEGVVKLLDFGLAKAFTNQREAAASAGENSPTLTMAAATEMGMILGTAAYMSPEQAKGKSVDKRADVWAFGVVLFELLTGERLFKGEDVADTLAQVLTKTPDFGRTPAKARRLLRECLERDQNQRLRDIGDARRLLLDDAPVGNGPSPSRRAYLGWIAAGVFALIAAGLGAAYWRTARPVERPLTRFSVDLGPDAVQGLRTTTVLSPDGTRIVFPMRGSNGGVQLATRTLDQPRAAAMFGTEGGSDPFFSPDGQWIGYFAGGKLKKVAVQGGAPVTLCDVGAARGGSWGEDGNIIFAPDLDSGLMRISSGGGTPQPLTKLGVNDVSHRWPQVLPGGRAVLFTTSTNPFAWEDGYISAVSLKTREVKTVYRGGYFGRYLPSPDGGGHLLYLHEGTLFAVPFDPGRMQTSGTPAPLVGDVAGNFVDAGGQFDSSRNGSLVYVNGEATGSSSSYPIVWMDSSGKFTPLVAKPGAYGAPRFSPDGKRMAFTARGAKGTDVWVYDLERDIPAQLTFSGPGNLEMVWTPDGKHIVFGSSIGDTAALWWIRSDGSGAAQKLLDQKNTGVGLRPQSFTPDGRRLAFDNNVKTKVGVEIWTLPLDLGDPDHPKPDKPEPFLTGAVREVDAAFSPDGKWMAYSSNESGTDDIFVRPFPGPGGKWRISTGGGKYPTWSQNGRELFYLSGADDRIMITNYTARGDSFSAANPRVWSDRQVLRPNFVRVLDLHPDAKRFAVFPRPDVEQGKGTLHVTFLLNFGDELQRRVPTGNK